jgi:hypothetical protein
VGVEVILVTLYYVILGDWLSDGDEKNPKPFDGGIQHGDRDQ